MKKRTQEEILKFSKLAVKNLEPKCVWDHFVGISMVPRGSYHEKKICSYLQNFAKTRKIEYKTDELHNIVMYLPCNNDRFKNQPKVTLQAHQDMVIEVNKKIHSSFNPLIDAIELKLSEDEKWIEAFGTSLGADNGIGVAIMLSIIDESISKNFHHGDLQFIFTTCEEEGFEGVINLTSLIVQKSSYCINLDCGSFGKFTIGCAGANSTDLQYTMNEEKIAKNFTQSYTIIVDSLLGGHSAGDIWRDRANAIKIMGRLLFHLRKRKIHFSISKICGGTHENAIPTICEVIINLSNESVKKMEGLIQKFESKLREEYSIEKKMRIYMKKSSKKSEKQYKIEFETKILGAIHMIPHGVIKQSHIFNNLCSESLNLGLIKKNKNGKLQISTLQRSNSSIEKLEEITETINFIGKFTGAFKIINWITNFEDKKEYSKCGLWPTEKIDSKLITVACKTYFDMFKTKAIVRPTHSGLECGIFKSKFPETQIIAMGPKLKNCHSIHEGVLISTVKPTYDIVKGIITRLYE